MTQQEIYETLRNGKIVKAEKCIWMIDDPIFNLNRKQKELLKKMRSQAEIYQALLDGKTIISNLTNTKIKLNDDGMLINEDEYVIIATFEFFDQWEILEEPVLYYRWKRINSEYHQVDISEWVREKDNFESDGWTRIKPGKTFKEIYMTSDEKHYILDLLDGSTIRQVYKDAKVRKYDFDIIQSLIIQYSIDFVLDDKLGIKL